MGRLFGIFEINTPSRENAQILTQLISDLEETYYSQIDNGLEVEQSLERTLAEINQKFTRLITEKKIYLVGNLNEFTIKEKINLAVGVLFESQLYISYLNNIGIFLVHKTKQDYKLIDIKKIAPEDKNQPDQQNVAKIFANLIAGELMPQDYLFLCNSSFLNSVSLERIQKIITSLPLHKAAEYFKNSLLQFEGHNFAAIMIKNSLVDTMATKAISSSLTSITELNTTETSTENLLEPSFWSNLKALPAFLNNLIGGKEGKNKEQNIEAVKYEATANAKSLSSNPLKKSGDFISLKLKKVIYRLGMKTPRLNEKFNNLKIFLRLKIAYFGNSLKKIPNLSKILLIAAIFLIILFIYSTSYFKNQQVKNEHSKEFDNVAAQIEEKRNQAESDLIYNNEDKARTEIADAQNLLVSLKIESKSQKDKQAELSQSIDVVVAKLRHITMINEPILIADLGAQQANNIDVKNLIYKNGNILAFDSINNFAYRINLDNQKIDKFNSNLSDMGQIAKANNIDDKSLIYTDKNSFYQFNNNFSPLDVSLPANSKIIDYANYLGRLYIIDLNSNQIYRLSQTPTGYGPSAAWLKDTLDLKNIVSMSIDTNIWLLENTGQIFKFNKGKKQSFSLKNVDPQLETPLQIFTNDETNYIYILEPKNKRIIVTDKEGNLITQYYSPSFDNLKAFATLEKEKKMFVINDNKIYFFNLTHIK